MQHQTGTSVLSLQQNILKTEETPLANILFTTDKHLLHSLLHKNNQNAVVRINPSNDKKALITHAL